MRRSHAPQQYGYWWDECFANALFEPRRCVDWIVLQSSKLAFVAGPACKNVVCIVGSVMKQMKR